METLAIITGQIVLAYIVGVITPFALMWTSLYWTKKKGGDK